ncbi:MAG TPA: S41 family peptidase [Gemmataceae bacterium]|nr:S41 family peptidase [Gemmataceae bacterium]
MSRRNLYWLLGITAVSLLGITVSYSAPSRERDKDYELVRLMVDVLNEVRERYVVDIDAAHERKLVEDMINGGLERLDPHSSYMPPREYKQLEKQSEGKFGGVGIQVGLDRLTRQLTVLSPMPGTPAYEAGVMAGDLIVKIDGKATENMRMSEAVDMIQGEPGQKVTLTVLHEGAKDPVELAITRAIIEVPCVLGDQRKGDNLRAWDFMIDKANKIGYIRLTNFSKTASKELRDAVEELQREGVRGLVIDLRNNPGGLLKEAREVSDLFLTEGRIVSTKGRNHKEEIYDAKPEGTLLLPAEKYPMAVLVNKYSASASEIVSAALQDHQRAVVIGERTYGKGSVQNIIEMHEGSDRSALKLTTASYWRPSGKNIHRFPDSKDSDDWGVQPNDTGYQLTPQARTALRNAGVPESVVAKLKAFPETRFPLEKDYVAELAKLLSKDELDKYKGKLLSHADHGFEVPMTDEERLEYIIYRTERDVVRTKATPAEKTKKDGKSKKPFVDRVLQKAVEHLKKEIDKAGAAAALVPMGNA